MTALGAFSSGDVLTAADLNAIGTWTTYTPTWTGSGGTPTLGDGTMTAEYLQINDLVHIRFFLTWGSTTSAAGISEWRFTFPSGLNCGQSLFECIGSANVHDANVGYYPGVVIAVSSTTFGVVANQSGNTIGAAVPMTWVSTDKVGAMITYRLA